MRKDLENTINFTCEMETVSDTFDRISTEANDPMLIYFTSGTTGYPKAVTHNHTYTLSHIITNRYWQCIQKKGLHLTVTETGWGKAF